MDVESGAHILLYSQTQSTVFIYTETSYTFLCSSNSASEFKLLRRKQIYKMTRVLLTLTLTLTFGGGGGGGGDGTGR